MPLLLIFALVQAAYGDIKENHPLVRLTSNSVEENRPFVRLSNNTIEENRWVRKELEIIYRSYQNYAGEYESALKNEQKLQALDSSLSEQSPLGKEFSIAEGKEVRVLPVLSYFKLVDPLTGESKASSEEKIKAVYQDMGILMAFQMMTGFLENYYKAQTPDDKLLLKETQKLMLSWAQQAESTKISQREREKLSSAFSYMVSEINRRSALSSYAPVYMTRRAFSLDQPEIARAEAARIEELLKSLQ